MCSAAAAAGVKLAGGAPWRFHSETVHHSARQGGGGGGIGKREVVFSSSSSPLQSLHRFPFPCNRRRKYRKSNHEKGSQ